MPGRSWRPSVGDRDVVTLIRRERLAGMLLARSGLADAIDAAVVCLASDGDDIFTSDPGCLWALAQAAGVLIELISV